MWRERLETGIHDDIWPGILDICQVAELIADPASEDDEPKIHHDWAPETTLSFLFLVYDLVDVEVDPGDAPYFCRITTQVRPRGYMVETDFYIHLPDTFELERLRPLLGNPAYAAHPPKLHYEFEQDGDPGTLIVEFNSGAGAGSATGLPVDMMLAQFAKHLGALRQLIRALRQLNRELHSAESLRHVITELEQCFPAT
jgi:hypothetical protein